QIDAQHIPYKGTGPAMTGLMGGEIQFMSVETAAAMPHIKAGKLKALALAASKRDASIDVATYAEQGLPKFEAYSWFAVYAPKGTPKDIVEKLSKSIAEAVKKQDVKDRFATLGANPVGSTPAELAKFQQSEIEQWANAVKISGASADCSGLSFSMDATPPPGLGGSRAFTSVARHEIGRDPSWNLKANNIFCAIPTWCGRR